MLGLASSVYKYTENKKLKTTTIEGNGNDNDDTIVSKNNTIVIIMFVIDLVICFSALYCFFKCVSNRKNVDSFTHFISACCCPLCYIAWVIGSGKCNK
jgi:hypothetical protein